MVRNPLRHGRDARPFYLCVRHSHLDYLRTRIMAPLVVAPRTKPSRLNPQLVVEGATVFLDPADLVTMNVRHLGKPIANLESERYRIVSALDLVFTGI